MPRYYFDVKDKGEYKDEIGVELPSLSSARKEAVHRFGKTLQSYAGAFTDGEVWQLTVADQCGAILLTFSFFMHASSDVTSILPLAKS